MRCGAYRYRNATPYERLKGDIRYAVRAHWKEVLDSFFTGLTGAAWIFALLFLLPIIGAFLR